MNETWWGVIFSAGKENFFHHFEPDKIPRTPERPEIKLRLIMGAKFRDFQKLTIKVKELEEKMKKKEG